MSPIQQMLLGAAPSAAKTYVDDVFSTYMYEGTGSNQSINNGIDLAGEGGMTWIKVKTLTNKNHELYDTERGATKSLNSNNGNGQTTDTASLTSFNNNGFSIGTHQGVNQNNDDFISFSFRKAPGFFDVVKYTGNNTNRSIEHNLGSTPGMIIVKSTGALGWHVWHKSLGNASNNQYDYILQLNNRASEVSGLSSVWYQNPTSTHFSVGTNGACNAGSYEYVAYLFADNVASFGENEDQSIIKCGTFQGGTAEVTTGFEPQWILFKGLQNNTDWLIYDTSRGMPFMGTPWELYPNKQNANTEGGNFSGLRLHREGFRVASGYNAKYVYCAIRRPDGYVGKPATAANEVFTPVANATDSEAPFYRSNSHTVDFAIAKRYNASESWFVSSKFLQGRHLQSDSNAAQSYNDYQNFYFQSGYNSYPHNNVGNNIGYLWKRHKGFDVVGYMGNGTLGRDIKHNLNAVPEMIWVKRIDDSKDWQVGHHGANGGTTPWNYYLELNSTAAESSQQGIWNNTAPTSTKFTVGNWTQVNNSSGQYAAMLFSSVSGISKVGYYDGSDSSQTITTGFQPRFWIVKSTTDAYPWLVLDTIRGWGSGNDKYLELNDTDVEATHDFGAPTSTGFTMTSSSHYNKSGKKYMYYAHA